MEALNNTFFRLMARGPDAGAHPPCTLYSSAIARPSCPWTQFVGTLSLASCPSVDASSLLGSLHSIDQHATASTRAGACLRTLFAAVPDDECDLAAEEDPAEAAAALELQQQPPAAAKLGRKAKRRG